MYKCYTKKGTAVWLAFVPDCGSNAGGWYVEIYLDPASDRFDDFCIHPEDCDCKDWNTMKEWAKNYVSEIEDY